MFWEVAMCTYHPRRRWWFHLAPFLSKEARSFVDTHMRYAATGNVVLWGSL